MSTDSPIAKLTPRERQVFSLVLEGFRAKEIAEVLCVSARTVESHKIRIFKKTGVRNCLGLLRLAIKNNLVQV